VESAANIIQHQKELFQWMKFTSIDRRFLKALHAWAPKQHSKTAQAKADRYPPSHFSPFNCSLRVVLQLEKGA